MIKGKKLAILILLSIKLYDSEGQVPQDSVQNLSEKISIPVQKNLNIQQNEKRQRNKTGLTVLVSCLFIISTTILLYNVRSK
jgi:hypothetical protein